VLQDGNAALEIEEDSLHVGPADEHDGCSDDSCSFDSSDLDSEPGTPVIVPARARPIVPALALGACIKVRALLSDALRWGTEPFKANSSLFTVFKVWV
jgi:hypothetical protein